MKCMVTVQLAWGELLALHECEEEFRVATGSAFFTLLEVLPSAGLPGLRPNERAWLEPELLNLYQKERLNDSDF